MLSPRAVVELRAEKSGFVSRCDARIIGEVIRDLGGGRLTKDSSINYDVGVARLAKPGDAVQKNSVLVRLHAASSGAATSAGARLKTAFAISVGRPKLEPLIFANLH